MKLYRFRIKLLSSYITPWQSDTIMGSLCWEIRQVFGDLVLADFLDRCLKGSFPFVVSSCFPGDFLPRPLVGYSAPGSLPKSKKERMASFAENRLTKKAEYVSIDEFNAIISGKPVTIGFRQVGPVSVGVMHNSISRLNNVVITGSLFEEQENFNPDPYLSLYALIEDGWLERFSELLASLARRGFGRRSSVGKGAFEAGPPELFDAVAAPSDPNAVVLLSNYVPAAGDPLEGQYRTLVKYGKLGNEFSSLDNPFKKPLLMFIPGSIFWGSEPRPYYGRVICGVSLQKEEVIQFGCALALPACVENPEP
jgi:CRISPR-associated protein Csm4